MTTENESCIHCGKHPDDCERAECMFIPQRILRRKVRDAASAASPQAAAAGNSARPDEQSEVVSAASPQGSATALVWPKERSVKRRDDMSPGDALQVGLDSDNDVMVSIWSEKAGYSSVEFCNGGGGGGRSPKTRLALIALMVAMEADAAPQGATQAAAALSSARPDEPKEGVGDPTALRAALEELVALKDLKDDIARMAKLPYEDVGARYADSMLAYERRQPAAWSAARAALVQQEPKP